MSSICASCRRSKEQDVPAFGVSAHGSRRLRLHRCDGAHGWDRSTQRLASLRRVRGVRAIGLWNRSRRSDVLPVPVRRGACVVVFGLAEAAAARPSAWLEHPRDVWSAVCERSLRASCRRRSSSTVGHRRGALRRGVAGGVDGLVARRARPSDRADQSRSREARCESSRFRSGSGRTWRSSGVRSRHDGYGSPRMPTSHDW